MAENELRVDVGRPPGRWFRWVAGAWAVLMGTGFVLCLLSDDVSAWQFVSWFAIVLSGVFTGSTRLRPQYFVVDHRGLRAPWDLRVPWSRITSVKAPRAYDQVVELNLTNGRQRRTQLPVEYAETVARVGGVPLE